MHQFRGKVRKNLGRGKKLGFPTANVNLKIQIPEGIYLAKVKISGIQYSALTFIGSAKTFNEHKYRSETYILDFNQDIYNKWISIKLIKKIRANKKFASKEGLISQMEKDKSLAKEYFK